MSFPGRRKSWLCSLGPMPLNLNLACQFNCVGTTEPRPQGRQEATGSGEQSLNWMDQACHQAFLCLTVSVNKQGRVTSCVHSGKRKKRWGNTS